MTSKALGAIAVVAGLALGAPGHAQNSDAPVDVTAAPPPSSDTIGPSQLQNFNLQGTITRPGAQPAQGSPASTTVPRPAPDLPGPTPAAPSSRTADRPAIEQPTASTEGQSPDSQPGFSNAGSATPSTPLDVTSEAAPQPAPEADLATAPSIEQADRFLSWPWLVALAALIGGGAYIGWSRRGRRQRTSDPGRMAFAGLVPDTATETFPPLRPRPHPVPPRAQPRPRPDPVPPPPQRADDGLIKSTVLKPELNVQFAPDRAMVTDREVLVQFDVVLTNSGSAPARDVLVEAKLVPAHPGQDQEIAAFFEHPQATGDRMAGIPPLGKVSLKSAVRLPIDQLRSFEVDGRKLFVPLVAFNILFRSNGGDGQASASFLVGRGNDEDEKLAPFRIDLGPRVFRGLSARPHSMGLTR